MLNVNIKIEASELAGAIQALAGALARRGGIEQVVNYTPVTQKAADPEPEKVAPEEVVPAPKEDIAPEIPLETVRKKLADLSQSGKQAEVRALITGFGVSKLTEIPKDKYPELMKKAGDL